MDFSFKVSCEQHATHFRINIFYRKVISLKLIYTQEVEEIIAVFSTVCPNKVRTLKKYMDYYSGRELMKKSLLIHRERTFKSLPAQFKEQGKLFALHTPDPADQSIQEQQRMLEWQGYMTMVVTVQATTTNPTQRVYKWK